MAEPCSSTTHQDYGDRPASGIPVRHFRQVLLWPLALDHPSLHSDEKKRAKSWIPAHEIVDCQAGCIEEQRVGWKWVKDPLEHITRGPGTQPAVGPDGCPTLLPPPGYEEFVYFHEFVQRFLYHRDGVSPDRVAARRRSAVPLYLFQRHDVRAVEFDVVFGRLGDHHSASVAGSATSARVTFAVERLNLYLFAAGVAMLAVELALDGAGAVRPIGPDGALVDGSDDLTFAHVQLLCDHLRRLHGPYWQECRCAGREKTLWSPRVPQRVVWLDSAGNAVPFPVATRGEAGVSVSEFYPYDYPGSLATVMTSADAQAGRSVPTFPHWRALMPLGIAGYDNADSVQVMRFKGRDCHCGGYGTRRHRIVWRNVADERMPQLAYVLIGQANCHSRLSDAQLGNILRSDWTRLCYCDEPGSGYFYDTSTLEDFERHNCYDRFFSIGTSGGARYLYSGYAFAAVGSGKFFTDAIIHHFRRHYFQMALIAQFQLAATLTYSNWISRAVAVHESELGERSEFGPFERAILSIEQEIEQFTHRFLFTGVSNQMQAREMYDLWRRHLRITELGEELRAEISWARDLLHAHNQYQQSRQTRRLNEIVLVVAALALPMTFLGMNAIVRDPAAPELDLFRHGTDWMLFFVLFSVSAVGVWLFTRVWRWLPWKWARSMLGFFVVAVLPLFLAYISSPSAVHKLLSRLRVW